MANPSAEQTKKVQDLSAVVNTFVGAINQKQRQSLTAATVNAIPGYSFNSPEGVMQQHYNAIHQSIDALMKVNAQTAGTLKAEWNSLEQPLNDEFNKLLSTKGFDQNLWENNFKNINAAIAAAKTSLPQNPELAAISTSIEKFQTEVIYQEIERLNRSVNNQKISYDSVQRGEQLFGADFKKNQMWKRYDIFNVAEYERPQPGTANSFTMGGTDNPGIGQDGYYRRENSNYILKLENGSITATYSKKETHYMEAVKAAMQGDPFAANKAWKESREIGSRKPSFAAQMKESIEALVVMKGVKSVTFDYPGQTSLSKYHIKNIEIAIAQAQEMVDKKISNKGKGVGVDLDLGKTCMDLLMADTNISDKRRQAILDSLKKLHASAEKAAGLEAAMTPAPAQQTAAAPAATATTPAATAPAAVSMLAAASASATATTTPAPATVAPEIGGIASESINAVEPPEPVAALNAAPEEPSFEPLAAAGGISSSSAQESKENDDDLISEDDKRNDREHDDDEEHSHERSPSPGPGKFGPGG